MGLTATSCSFNACNWKNKRKRDTRKTPGPWKHNETQEKKNNLNFHCCDTFANICRQQPQMQPIKRTAANNTCQLVLCFSFARGAGCYSSAKHSMPWKRGVRRRGQGQWWCKWTFTIHNLSSFTTPPTELSATSSCSSSSALIEKCCGRCRRHVYGPVFL